MKYSLQIILLSLLISSCNPYGKENLQLTGPTVEEAEELNKTTEVFVDGIYEESNIETSLKYKQYPEAETSYYVNYKPIIVPKDFKILRYEMGLAGKPVIDVELHQEAHDKWFNATQRAYQNQSLLFIVIEGKVVSAPSLRNGPISGGRLQISGDLTIDQIENIIQGIKERYPEKKIND